MKKFLLFAITLLIIFPTVFCRDFSVVNAAKAFDTVLDHDGKLIVVIDPGHGGTNKGAEYKGKKEKEMTVIIAKAMKEELEKYDGVTVYLTHDNPEQTIEIKDRVNKAATQRADFFFSLHLNAKANHDLYGAEVWIPYKKPILNHEAYKFAEILLPRLEEMGLYNRGIKVHENPETEDEYYGVMRYCNQKGIASCIIEHCHVDNAADDIFWDSDEALKALGVADATAAAEYFGLSSSKLGISYASRELPDCPYEPVMYDEDLTRPEICQIEVVSKNDDGTFTFKIDASDEQSPILYYAVSRDGGHTFDPANIWPNADAMKKISPKSCQINVEGVTEFDKIQVKVYNRYDVTRVSNIEDMALYFIENDSKVPYVENRIEQLRQIRYMKIAVMILGAVLVVFLLLMLVIVRIRKKQRRRKRERAKLRSRVREMEE